ncbi:MAG: response regulator transcription factor [Myxococcales bacterium]|nr:response regulator transcription factor [Myxococcales bacterium]
MWILVVGPEAKHEREGSAADVLRQLGCRIRVCDLWDSLDDPAFGREPPAAILVEAEDEVDAGRAALQRLRAVKPLVEVPALIAVSVSGLGRLDTNDGFDDFVLVPYVPAELYLRVRRAEWKRSDFSGQERIKMGALCIDLAAHEVTVDGRAVQLTHQEFALLRFLTQQRGRVFSRQQLLERVWGVDYYGSSRTVDIHIRRLRMKLGSAVDSLETVRGVGYKIKAP